MKKQKKMMETTPSSSTTTTTSKKKKVSKREVQKQSLAAAAVAAAVQEEKAAGHGGDRAEGSCPVAAAASVVENDAYGNDDGLSMACNDQDWRAWWRPGVLVDEQMSWGSVWFSFWEQENDNCHAMFYSDVLEEDDIWDLRSIKQVPQ